MKALVRFVCERLSLAVVAVCTVFMVLVFVNVEVNATHVGSYPIGFQGNTNEVEVRGEEQRGALRTGDRIDLRGLTPQQRFSLLAAPSEARMTVLVTRGDRTFPLRLSATPPDYSRGAMLARDIGIPLSFFLSLGFATALFLVRPRPITLAFYVYTMLMLVKVYKSALDLATWPINVTSDLAMQVVYPAAQLMILVFAQRLYGRPSRAWPWFFGTALALSLVVFIVWLDPIVWMVFQKYGLPGPMRIFMSFADTLLLITVLSGLAYIASGANAIDRGRITWVVAGIALAPILDLTWSITDVLSALVGDTSNVLLAIGAWTDGLLPWFGLIGSIFVLYGFLSQRVVDFRFVIGRAALYGVTTLALLFFFGVIEWWAEQLFESTRPAVYVSLIAALAIGFSLNSAHGRIEAFLGGFLLREQRRREQTLRRAARALANTSSEKTLVEFLIDAPVRVLELASAALFLAQEEGGSFRRVAAREWTDSDVREVDPESALVVELRTQRSSMHLDAQLRAGLAFPTGPTAPTLALPLVMRGSVFGFVMYGGRPSEVPLTPDERALLESIAAGAASAYDHIDARRARDRISTLEQHLLSLGASIPQ